MPTTVYLPHANQTAQTSGFARRGLGSRPAGADTANARRQIERMLRLASDSRPLGQRDAFSALADQWHRETGYLSDPADIAMHPAYLRIIAMGGNALPMILDDLRRRGGLWYIALDAITGASPLPLTPNPTLRDFKDAWLQWGSDRNLS
jgi:hypothetical protein